MYMYDLSTCMYSVSLTFRPSLRVIKNPLGHTAHHRYRRLVAHLVALMAAAVLPSAAPRLPGHGHTHLPDTPESRAWREVFINPIEAGQAATMASSMAAGHSLMVIDVLSTAAECASLASDAAAAAQRERDRRGIAGLVRRPVEGFLGKESAALCDALLLRQLALLDSSVPTLTRDLFGDSLSPSSCTHNPLLAWSEGEPAINVYTEGGCFTPHEDEQRLTCLLNLSQRNAYTGGGTAFWSLEAAGPRVDRERPLTSSNSPTHLITPAAGTAILDRHLSHLAAV